MCKTKSEMIFFFHASAFIQAGNAFYFKFAIWVKRWVGVGLLKCDPSIFGFFFSPEKFRKLGAEFDVKIEISVMKNAILLLLLSNNAISQQLDRI